MRPPCCRPIESPKDACAFLSSLPACGPSLPSWLVGRAGCEPSGAWNGDQTMARSATDRAGRPPPGLSRGWGTMMKKPHYTDAGKSPSKARKDAATALAVAALSFLAAEPERLERFLA